VFIARKLDSSAKFTRALIGIAISIAASAAFGIIFAQTFHNGMFKSMGISLLFATAVSVLSSLPFEKLSVLNRVLIGWIGAMLGTVIGTMLYSTNKTILIVDTLFIIFMYLLQKFSEWKADKEQEQQHQKKKASKKSSVPLKRKLPSYAGVAILAAGVIVIAGIIWLQKDEINTAQVGQPLTQAATYEEQNDLQVATIEVTSTGFTPRNTEFKSGTMIKAIFHVASNGEEGLNLQSADLDVNAPLKSGDNIFLINDPQPGTYEFTLGTGTSKCTFTVVPSVPAAE